MALGALIGGGISAVGGIFNAAKRKKALKQASKDMARQRDLSMSNQKKALDNFSNRYRGIIDDASQVQSLNLGDARGLYSGLVDESQAQAQGLMNTANQLGQEFTSEQQKLGQQSVRRAQDRLGMANSGRVAGEEAMMDAARRGTAESAARVTRTGGTGSNVLAAINQAVSAGNQRELGVEAQLGSVREQRAAQARAGLMNAEQRNEQGRLNAMEYAGGLKYGSQQTGANILIGALGQQAGFEGNALQAENESAMRRQQFLTGMESELSGQILEGDISREQMRQGFNDQINQANLDRRGSSVLGGVLGGIGTGLMGATNLAAATPAGGRSGFQNFLMGTNSGGQASPIGISSVQKRIGSVAPSAPTGLRFPAG